MKELKRLGEGDYEEAVALSQFAFQYKLSDEEREKKVEEFRNQVIWGHIVEGKLAAKLHLFPFTCYINGESFDVGGVCSVATWPEYRRQGSIRALMQQSLQYMREIGQTVSYLHPFSVAFYRKFGWELTFSNRNYKIPINHLKRNWAGKGLVRRIDADIPLLHTIYTDYARKYNGMLGRDENWWEQRVLKDQPQIAVAYNEAGNPGGYIIYHVKDQLMTVKEMVSTSLNEWKLLYQFIANHDSMAENVTITVPENDHLPFILDEPRFEQMNIPFCMARIVDVLPFLKKYPFHIEEGNATESIILQVDDEFLPENEGVYEIKLENGMMDVCMLKDFRGETGIHCSIQALTAMFLGYKRPSTLHNLGMLSGEKEEIERFETMIPSRQTYMIDFF
ncbi:GNAT family N-acetyltransferase [Bacillus sp. FSL K6-3431]|uniref:GNAT family N-acetyltransferase n=1 Tax=Bacillus sp. FSL K6-3431 TaxID=2921500 RepID=UPI0030F9E7A2